MHHVQARRRLVHIPALSLLAVVALVSCGGSSSKASSPTTSPAGATTTSAPPRTGPATAVLSFSGDAGLAGSLLGPQVSCTYPTVSGLSVIVFAQTPDAKASTFVVVTKAGVRVRVASGTGKTYHERDFAGTGVTGYDPARGAHLDSLLQPAAPSKGATAGSLGTVAGIKGDIACGGQRPGSSTVVLSGESGDGTVSGKLDPVRVGCTKNALGNTVNIVGIAHVGAKQATVQVNGLPGTFSVVFTIAGGATRFFQAGATATSSTTATGLHLSGDAAERDTTGAHNTLHVSGSATCGSA